MAKFSFFVGTFYMDDEHTETIWYCIYFYSFLPKKNNYFFFLADMPYFMKNTDRIIGGQDAPEPIQWQVALHLIPINSRINCGATILDDRTLLSAAHCFDYFPNKEDWLE